MQADEPRGRVGDHSVKFAPILTLEASPVILTASYYPKSTDIETSVSVSIKTIFGGDLAIALDVY